MGSAIENERADMNAYGYRNATPPNPPFLRGGVKCEFANALSSFAAGGRAALAQLPA